MDTSQRLWGNNERSLYGMDGSEEAHKKKVAK